MAGGVRAETGGHARASREIREVYPGERRQKDTSRGQSQAGGYIGVYHFTSVQYDR